MGASPISSCSIQTKIECSLWFIQTLARWILWEGLMVLNYPSNTSVPLPPSHTPHSPPTRPPTPIPAQATPHQLPTPATHKMTIHNTAPTDCQPTNPPLPSTQVIHPSTHTGPLHRAHHISTAKIDPQHKHRLHLLPTDVAWAHYRLAMVIAGWWCFIYA